MEPPILFTRHALVRLAERGLPPAWAERVALRPEWTEPDPQPGVIRAFGRIAEAGGRVLRVAYIDRADGRHVLTVHFDDRQTRRRRRCG